MRETEAERKSTRDTEAKDLHQQSSTGRDTVCIDMVVSGLSFWSQ